MLEDNHGLLAQPGEHIAEDIANPPTGAKAQATPPGVELQTGLEDAERTQVTPVDLDVDVDEEEKAQATPPDLDVDMANAEEPSQQVYVEEEHLPEWILSRIANKQKATLEMEFAIRTLPAKSRGFKEPKLGDRLQAEPALESLQDEFFRLTCCMRQEEKKASVRAQCLEAAIAAVKREIRTVDLAAAHQGGTAAVQTVEQPSPADTLSPATTPQGTPRGKAQKGEPKGSCKGGTHPAKGKPTTKGKHPAKAQAPHKGQKGGESAKARATPTSGKGQEPVPPPCHANTGPEYRAICLDGITVQTTATAVVAAVL